MESHLMAWLDHQNQNQYSPTSSCIKTRACALFQELKAKYPEENQVLPANNHWWNKFGWRLTRARANVRLQGGRTTRIDPSRITGTGSTNRRRVRGTS